MVFIKKEINLIYQKNILKILKHLFMEKIKIFLITIKRKIKFKNFNNLNDALKNILQIIKNQKLVNKTLYYLVHVLHHLIVLKILKIEGQLF